MNSEHFRKKGQELRNLISKKKKNDSIEAIHNFLSQDNVHEASKQFKKYRNAILNKKSNYMQELKKYEEKLKERTETLKNELCQHTRASLSRPDMTEDEVVLHHKNCSPFKLCCPNDKPIFVRLKKNTSDKPINEKIIQTLFPSNIEVTAELFANAEKVIDSIMNNATDLIRRYELRIKLIQQMEKRIIEEFKIQITDDDMALDQIGSNVNQSLENIVNYVSSGSEGTMDFEIQNESNRHHPYNPSKSALKNKNQKAKKLTPYQIREAKIQEEFSKYEQGYVFFSVFFMFDVFVFLIVSSFQEIQ